MSNSLLTKGQWMAHYRAAIDSKYKLIKHYEYRGQDLAVELLEREIANMRKKIQELVR